MPSISDKQKALMAAASHSAAFAKRAGIMQRVAQEFNRADNAKKQKKK